MLIALAKLHAVGVLAPRRLQVALLGGYSNEKSGGFAKPAAALAEMGLVSSSAGTVSLTASGVKMAGADIKPATTRELHGQLQALLSTAEWRLLEILIKSYPTAISRAKLAEQTGYSNAKSGGFAGPVAKLTTLGLAKVLSAGMVAGTPMLFVNGPRK